jgi:LL-diaminopimelate aminotransferase
VRSKRLRDLPAYLFADLAARRRRKEAEGTDVIDLSIGDPDLGAPEVALEALAEYAADRRLHRYPPHWAVEAFNVAVAEWMMKRFSVELDPETEILPLLGTKEGIAHLPLALLDPGDRAMVPDPGYPVYARGVWFAGGEVDWMPLREAGDFLPDTAGLEASNARIAYLNYPNNPTSAVADLAFYERVIEIAAAKGILIANDAAYSEVTFDGYRSPSLLEIPGAKDVSVEFHSFSKTFAMAGWRVGFVAGSAGIVGALKALKSNMDSDVFGAILLAAARCLRDGWDAYEQAMGEYATRRAVVTDGLKASGIAYHSSPATLYVWARVPGGGSSTDFATALLEDAGILIAPGVGFGEHGEGYFRISITCPTDSVRMAAKRLQKVSTRWKT